MNLFLGIDTSCYTTSLCLVDSSYHVVADERIILSVKSGERGLSQSNMVYQHMMLKYWLKIKILHLTLKNVLI